MNVSEVGEALLLLSSMLDDRIEKDKEKLNAKSNLIMDLRDVGFRKTFDTKYTYDIKNRGKSYITFTVVFKGRNVDILEDHLVIIDKKEVPLSTIENSFAIRSVRYSRVLSEIGERTRELCKEIEEGKNEKV